MRIMWRRVMVVRWCCSAVTAGCASRPVVPEMFDAQLDKALTFTQVLASPEAYVGKRVAVGGMGIGGGIGLGY